MNTIEQLRGEIRDIEGERNNAFLENSHLQADLYAVCQEAEFLRRELEASQVEAEELRVKLNFYCSEVERIEDELVAKESERADILKHLRFLSEESSELGANQECLTQELEQCKLKLTEAEKDIMKLEACIEEKECTIKSLEGKLQELACIASQLEEQLQCVQQENVSQSEELIQCRETLQELLMQKEALCQQLTTCENCKIKIETELQERKSVIRCLEAELAKERDHSSDLEETLRQTKLGLQEMFLCNQKYEEEILGLGEKIKFLCAKLNEEKQENEEFNFNIETLRKQVMEARHEKSYSMKQALKKSQRRTVAMATQANPLTGISNTRDILIIENGNKSTNRYCAMNGRTSSRRASCSYPTQRRGLSACGFYNENIKEADTRYQLYLENLSKLQSYTQIYKKQRKGKAHKQSKHLNLKENKKELDDDKETFNVEYEQLNEETNTLPCNRVCQKNRNPSNNSIKSQEKAVIGKDIKKKLHERLSHETYTEKDDNNKGNQEKDNPKGKKNEIEKHDAEPEEYFPATETENFENAENSENSNAENIAPTTTFTVQHVTIKNKKLPNKAMIQQTYLLRNGSEKTKTCHPPEYIKYIGEITNHGQEKMQNKLNKLKSLEKNCARSKSKTRNLSDSSRYSNIYVNLANHLHKKINGLKK